MKWIFRDFMPLPISTQGVSIVSVAHGFFAGRDQRFDEDLSSRYYLMRFGIDGQSIR